MSVVLKLFFFFNFNSISSANTSLRWLISHPPKKTENKNGQGNVCCRTNGNKVWYVKMFKWNVTFFHPPSSATWTAQERRRINWAWRRQATLGFSSGNNQINASNQVINAGDGWWKVCWEGLGWAVAIVMLHQVWQMSDTADSTISVTDPVTLSLAK